MIIPSLYIGTSEHRGRGVFSSEALAAGIVIEIAPVIVMSSKDRQLLDQTLLHIRPAKSGDRLLSNNKCEDVEVVDLLYNYHFHICIFRISTFPPKAFIEPQTTREYYHSNRRYN